MDSDHLTPTPFVPSTALVIQYDYEKNIYFNFIKN